MTNRKIVIIGGVAGGASAAARARRTDEHAEIIMLEKGPYISFANCGLPYFVGREIGDRSALLLQTPESFHERFNVDVRVFHEAISIERERKVVRVRNLQTGAEYEESYTSLVLAPGAAPIKPPLPGIDLPNLFTVRTVPDADAIRAETERCQVARAVVVGAGFIGLEMVENLLRLGLTVTLVEKAGQVLPPLDPEMAAFVSGTLQQMGVEVITDDGIAAFDGEERATAVRLESGRLLGAQLLGGNGVDKRADLFATAIAARMNAADLTNLDLAYAPPFGAAKDPAIVAGMVLQNIGREQLPVVTAAELLAKLNEGRPLQVIDVRQPYEYDMGAIPGAVNIPVDEVRHRLAELDPALATVVYDGNGSKAYLAVRTLMQNGFASVASLTGGYTLWPVSVSG